MRGQIVDEDWGDLDEIQSNTLFSPKAYFYAKQTTQSPYNYSETLKTQECHQNTRILKTYPRDENTNTIPNTTGY